MKSIYLFVAFILISVSGFTQLKVTQDIRYYRNVRFNLSPTVPKATSDTGVVNLGQMRDSIAAAVVGAGSGTVTSVGSGLGLSGTVTTTGTLSLDTANASVLSRQRAANTYQAKGAYLVTADIAGKLNKADSSGVAAGSYVTGKDFVVGLATKIGTADTISIGTVLNIDLDTDTLATKAYARTTGGAGGVTSVATGLGLTGGTITTTGTLVLDTANTSVLSRQRAVNTYQPKCKYAYNTSAQSTTQTGLIAINNLSLALEASSVYEICFNLNASTDATASLVNVGVNMTNTTGAAIKGSVTGSVVVAGYSSANVLPITAFNTQIPNFVGAVSKSGGITGSAIVVTGSTAPSIYLQFCTNAGTSTIGTYSYLKATKL